MLAMTINIFVWHMLVNISTGVVLLKDKAVENRIHEHGWNRDLVGTGTWLVQGPGWYRDVVGTGTWLVQGRGWYGAGQKRTKEPACWPHELLSRPSSSLDLVV